MTVRVRFAPSPTGYLHIGGARTALYNYLFAKAKGGSFIVRVEDTDKERSTTEFEKSQMSDLSWLGLNYDEGPQTTHSQYAPYRQSERMDLYVKYSQQLLEQGKAFYDFCAEEELEEMSRKSKELGSAPYTGKWRESQYWDEAKERVKAGESAPIRFLAQAKSYTFTDHVRGEITFPDNMVGDFVIMRSNGLPTYNFCNVVDDYLMEITHVIRGDDHTNNTLRQLMVYESFGWSPPEFAHVSLLIGADRQKLSKRHGATSVRQYREEGYLAQALNNYLTLLGWSHPEEKDIFQIEDLPSVFDLNRFSKSQAVYDIEKLKWVNGQHIRKMQVEALWDVVKPYIPKEHFIWEQSLSWQHSFISLMQEKVELLTDFTSLCDQYILSDTLDKNEKLTEILSWETTPQIRDYVISQLENVSDQFIDEQTFSEWMNYCKKELKIKGKPLFMGLRGVLTGMDHGPDLKVLIPLTPIDVLKERLKGL